MSLVTVGVSVAIIVGFGGIYLWQRNKSFQKQASNDLKEFAVKIRTQPKIYDFPIRLLPSNTFKGQQWVEEEGCGAEIVKKFTNNINDPNIQQSINSLKFITYNIWFSTHYQIQRTKALLECLAETDADVVCLQEVLTFTLDLISENPFIRENYILSDLNGTTFEGYGVVILLHKRVAVQCSGFQFYIRSLPSIYSRRALFLDLLFADQNEKVYNIARICTVHLESSGSQTRTEQLTLITNIFSDDFPYNPAGKVIEMSASIQHHPNIHYFLMGDCNFDPAFHRQHGEGEAKEELVVKRFDFTDCWELLRPEENGFTMPKNGPNFAPRRIDRVLVKSTKFVPINIDLLGTENLPGIDCDTCSGNGRPCSISDHFGLTATLNFVGKKNE